jgi:hypothetical protein
VSAGKIEWQEMKSHKVSLDFAQFSGGCKSHCDMQSYGVPEDCLKVLGGQELNCFTSKRSVANIGIEVGAIQRAK